MMAGHSKGDAALPLTKRRRAYHQAYYRDVTIPKQRALFGRVFVPCPTCDRRMLAGRERCARCDERFGRWDKCACGREKIKRSKVCRHCAGLAESERRAGLIATGIMVNPFCPNKSEGVVECDTFLPHSHCQCGLPMAAGAQACAFCIAEQPRVEFKVWPKEDAA